MTVYDSSDTQLDTTSVGPSDIDAWKHNFEGLVDPAARIRKVVIDGGIAMLIDKLEYSVVSPAGTPPSLSPAWTTC